MTERRYAKLLRPFPRLLGGSPHHDVRPPVGEESNTRQPRSVTGRLGSAVLGVWGALTGIAPHVLHHVGPLAGTVLLAGAGGRLLFGAIALGVSVPFLTRMYRRFRTWVAPAVALAVMAAMFAVSSLVVGPVISGEDTPPEPAVEQPGPDEHGH